MIEIQWEHIFGWFIGIALVFAFSKLWTFLRGVWVHVNKWGSTIPNKVKFLSAMPRTFQEVHEGCVLYDTDSNKFITVTLFNDSAFLMEFGWGDNSRDVILVTDEGWGYKFHPDYSLETLTTFVGDKINTCVFVPCKIYLVTKSLTVGSGLCESQVQKPVKCYVELDHLNAFRASRYLCTTEYGHRTREELEELEAVVRIEHNQVEIFEGSVEELTDRYGLSNCSEPGIIEWCQGSGHAFQISVGGTV